jgi:hypothetical protein
MLVIPPLIHDWEVAAMCGGQTMPQPQRKASAPSGQSVVKTA